MQQTTNTGGRNSWKNFLFGLVWFCPGSGRLPPSVQKDELPASMYFWVKILSDESIVNLIPEGEFVFDGVYVEI